MLNYEDLEKLNIDKSWSLFLDRDGVINKKLDDDYVKRLDEFELLPGAVEAIAKLSKIFGRIFLITNQRGIARELMTVQDLEIVHNHMLEEIKKAGGKIDKIYFCPHNNHENCGCRKPRGGMGLQAKKDFPEVDFSKSIMAGDSKIDMEFGQFLGMFCFLISRENQLYNFAEKIFHEKE